jgi:hypothetical protein
VLDGATVEALASLRWPFSFLERFENGPKLGSNIAVCDLSFDGANAVAKGSLPTKA